MLCRLDCRSGMCLNALYCVPTLLDTRDTQERQAGSCGCIRHYKALSGEPGAKHAHWPSSFEETVNFQSGAEACTFSVFMAV